MLFGDKTNFEEHILVVKGKQKWSLYQGSSWVVFVGEEFFFNEVYVSVVC